MAERRHPWIRSVCALSLLVDACASPEIAPAEVAAIQLSAATEIVTPIAANPGSIVTICVGYEGGGGVVQLPSVEAPGMAVAGRDGCRDAGERLTAVDGGGQAIAVTVRRPKPIGRSRAEVAVFTSTGTDDLAAYTCTIRRRDGVWQADGCDLDAIS